MLEDPDPTHPVGAKGIGEPSLVGAAPAIANAIRDATGARLRTLPMTPERVLDCAGRAHAMKLDDYPPQEPLSEAGQAYGAECWRRRRGHRRAEEFAFGADPYQRLLVFEAAQPDGRVLLFWHGGGWTSGYKEWMAFMAPPFNAAGVTFVSAGYRLAPQHVFPAALDDCVRGDQVGDCATSRSTAAIPGESSSAAIPPAATTPRCWRSRSTGARIGIGDELRARLPAALRRFRIRARVRA